MADRRTRTQLILELLIVLGVFPLTSTLAAFISVAQHLTHGKDTASHFQPPVPSSTPWSLVFGILLELTMFVGAALVLYLLQRSGEGTTAIGLDGRRPRGDAALLFPVFSLAFIVAQSVIGGAVMSALHLKSLQVNDHVSAVYLPVLLVGAIGAGVVEEIVVLGFLVRRLEQFGLPSWAVVGIAVVVRVSYHVYYLWGVVPILFWAIGSVLIYRRVRRLWPFIVVHAFWDATIFVSDFVRAQNAFVGVMFLAFGGVTLACTLAWRREATPIFTSP